MPPASNKKQAIFVKLLLDINNKIVIKVHLTAIQGLSDPRAPMDAKILVVDDSKNNRETLRSVLEYADYQVLTAESGEKAIDISQQELPDLILMDVVMPGMDGITTCRHLTSHDETKNIPVVMITAKNEPEDLQRGLEAGAVDYVKKPFIVVELLARVKTILRLKEAQDKLVEQEKKIAIMELAGAAAHELNQPLTVINCQIKLLEESLEKITPLPRREIEIINESVDRMTDIIRKIGTITKYKTKDYLLGDRIIDLDEASENVEE
jgi:DNA-binding response OmpR family regulator